MGWLIESLIHLLLINLYPELLIDLNPAFPHCLQALKGAYRIIFQYNKNKSKNINIKQFKPQKTETQLDLSLKNVS